MARAPGPCTLHFGPFKGRTVEQLMFNLEGYDFLNRFVRCPTKEMESLARFISRVLELGESPLITRKCSCGNYASDALYFWGTACYPTAEVYCQKCVEGHREIDSVYRLIPLRFSSQKIFVNDYNRKRYLDLLIQSLGLTRPITADKAYRYFFPREAESRDKEISVRIPRQLQFLL